MGSSRRARTLVLSVMVLAACTAPASVEDHPRETTRAALESLASAPAVDLGLSLTRPLPTDEYPEAGLSSSALTLLNGSTLEVRSAASEAAHARIVARGATRDALKEAAERLSTEGLGELTPPLLDEGWIRISVPPSVDMKVDRIARAIGTSGLEFLDEADEVTYVGREELGDRVRLVANDRALRRFVDDVASALTSTGEGADAALAEMRVLPQDEGTSAADTSFPVGGLLLNASDASAIEVWIADEQLRALTVELRWPAETVRKRTVTLLLELNLAPDSDPVPPTAPPFALAALVSELLRAASAETFSAGDEVRTPGSAGQRTEEEGAEHPRDPEGEPAPLREGGVLEGVFGEDHPFRRDADFDCVSEEDLAVLGQALGPDAVEEFEELISQGYLERC
jgi:hypothetical protein